MRALNIFLVQLLYKTNFVVKPSMMSEDRVIFLDLGVVEVMAEVIVNGINKGSFGPVRI